MEHDQGDREGRSEERAAGVRWKGVRAAPRSYRTPVFLSYPKPLNAAQASFVTKVADYLAAHDFAGRTLGVTDYDQSAPLHAIRRLMLECYGLITLAFRRTYLERASGNYRTNLESVKPYDLSGTWMTSPWSHIEPAMAYQVGRPVLILRESGVVADGILEKGVTNLYLPEFKTEGNVAEYFENPEWRGVFQSWEAEVRSHQRRRGEPPAF